MDEEPEIMCAYCGEYFKRKEFPNSLYAKCKKCEEEMAQPKPTIDKNGGVIIGIFMLVLFVIILLVT